MTGADDGLIKAWDRRTISDGKPVGGFIGHKEGVTYVDAPRNPSSSLFCSNSKDQTVKLWDLREMNAYD